MMARTCFLTCSRRTLATLAVASVALVPNLAAAAPSAATLYQRATVREQTVRHAANASAAAIRTAAKAFESVVRTYPKSGYADNALWQGAGLFQLAFEKTGAPADQANARRLLGWLVKEYPTSPYAKQAPTRLASLGSSKPAAAVAASTPAPTPVAAPSAAPSTTAAAVPPATPASGTAPASTALTTSKAPATTSGKTAAPRTDDLKPASEPVITHKPLAPPPMPLPARRAPATTAAALPSPVETAAPALPSDVAPVVEGISRQSLPKGDRIVIELAHEQNYAVTRQANPDRLVVELLDAPAAPAVRDEATKISGALVASASVGGKSRNTEVVLNLSGKPRYSTFPLYSPFRLAIDVESDQPVAKPATYTPTPTSPSASAMTVDAKARVQPSSPLPSPAITGKGDYSLSRQLGLRVSRIVIDPGHGGHDPGAEANGVTEASVVLDIALRVEKILTAQPGVEVVLTRRTDEFVPLEERTAIANRQSADMFLSIHANASKQDDARGIETYFLNFASNPHAEAVAARENATSAGTMGGLPQLVKTITLNNKLAESKELATLAQASLVKQVAPASKSRDLGVKQAPFVVLIGAEMPSILAEVSFVTNKSESALLKQAAYRQRIAQALANAVMQYQSSLKVVPAVAPRAEQR
jgi:N-acetylmuramoyl-L-alanine amidase